MQSNLVVFFCLFGASLGLTVEEKLNATIESLKVTLNNGDPANGIPSFNPLNLTDVHLNINESDVVKTNLTFKSVVGNGLTDFIATGIKFDILTFGIAVNLTFDHINVVGEYDGDLELFGFVPLYGQGTFSADVTQLDISVSLRLGTVGGNVSIDNFLLSVDIQDSKFEITGLLNNPDASALLTAVINDMVPDFIHNRSGWLTARISEILSQVLNSLVEGMTVDDLLNLMEGESTLAPEVTTAVPKLA